MRIAEPIRAAVVTLAAALPLSPAALSHGGGLDKLGCHHDRKHGGYHCHRGALDGRVFGSSGEARQLLRGDRSLVALRPSRLQGEYDRDDYLPAWADRNGDCQDTRQEVLIAESVEPVRLDSGGCRVVSGRWHDPYTGRVFTDPSNLDIDHLVPLAEAHRSGALRWSSSKRRSYANDLERTAALIAVEAGANRSKGARDPAQWLPSNAAYHCEYVRNWTALKSAWGLSMDPEERLAVDSVLARCP